MIEIVIVGLCNVGMICVLLYTLHKSKNKDKELYY